MIVDVTQADGPAAIRGNLFTDPVPGAYFLTALFGSVPVGQVCHLLKEGHWFMDFLFVREDLRDQGIGELLVECCCHDALRHTDEIRAMARRNGRLTPGHLERHTRSLGGVNASEVRILREHQSYLLNARDLRPLRDRVERGVVGRVTFPYRREMSRTVPEDRCTP